MPNYSNNPFHESGLGPEFQAAQQRLETTKAEAHAAARALEEAQRRAARHHDETKSIPSESEVLALQGLVATAESKAAAARAARSEWEAEAMRHSKGGPSPATPEAGGWSGRNGAPALTLTEADVKDLHTAALARRIESKTVSSSVGPMATISDFRLDVYPFLRDKVRILDHIPTEQTDAVSVTYYRALAAASAATAVAEGADKPESNPTWESQVATVRKLAHWTKATDEVLADFNQFRNVIGAELLSGLIEVENSQLITGNGTPPNLTGLLNVSGIQTRARGTDSNLDALLKAVTDLRTGTAFTEADTVIVHPTNFEVIRLSKATGGEYLLGNPLSNDPAMLGSARFLVTTRMTVNTAIVANLKVAAKVFVRERPRVEVNAQGGEAEWKANLTLLRAEERLTLAVPRPTAIVKVTGLN